MSTLFAKKSFFVESGTYQQPMLRTYQTTYNDAIVGQYIQDTNNGTEIVPNAFNNISAAILSPSAAPTGTVNIDNGWQDKRMSFIIEVETVSPFDSQMSDRSVVLTGYTSYADVSITSHKFDDNMRLYFNTSTIINTMTHRHPNGSVYNRRHMVDSSHLLNVTTTQSINTTLQAQDQYRDNTLWFATPRNVIYEMNSINNNNNGVNNNVIDYRIRSNPMGLDRSSRENAVPTTYLSKILRGVTDSVTNMAAGIGVDENDALTNASHGVRERLNDSDPIMMEILMGSDYNTTGYITWGRLCALIPNLNNSTAFSTRASRVVQTNTPDAVSGDFSHWSGVGAETLIANNIAQLVPAMMTTCMIGTISFAFSNDNLTLTPTLTITSGLTMIDGIAFQQVSSQFESRFNTEIAPMITDQGRSVVNMIVQCSLGTETFVSLSRNGGPTYPFCAPTFCDSLYTPILSPSAQGLTDIASDLQNIANSVNNAQYMQQPNQPNQSFIY